MKRGKNLRGFLPLSLSKKSHEGGKAARTRLIQRSPALARSPEGEEPFGRAPQGAKSPRRRRKCPIRVRTRGELKTVRWTVFKRGKPCDRGLSPTSLNIFMLFQQSER